MKVFQMNEAKNFIQRKSIHEALGFNLAKKQVIAVVGAGGKTTLIEHLAKELVAQGKRVVITTTTHMFLPKACGVLVEDKNQVLRMLEQNGFVVVGKPCENEKIGKVSEPFFEWLGTISDYVLVEADGSKRLPIKVPDQHEPALPFNTDLMIVVAGLSCLEEPLKDCCHRWQLAMQLLNCEEDHKITPIEVAKLLNEGYCSKQLMPYKILLNQCELKKAQTTKREIMEQLSKNHIPREDVVWSSFF